MPNCANCKYNKIKYAPYIKARVETCTKVGECEQITKMKERKAKEREKEINGRRLDKYTQENKGM